MAVTTQVLQSGIRNHVIKVDISGTNSDASIVDLSALSHSPTSVILKKVEWSLSDAVTLEWDATTDTVLAYLADGEGCLHYDPGIKSNAGTGATGDVFLTNAGDTAAGSIILYFKKRYS